MKVVLERSTPDPRMAIIKAARRCYSPEEMPTFDKAKSKKEFIKFLLDRKHLSPFEFASFTFSITGISRCCSLQIVRHRIASYCQQSQRYCKGYPGFVIPDSIVNKITGQDTRVSEAITRLITTMRETCEILAEEGIPQEDIRYFWNEGTKTNLFMKMNVRSLMNFFSLRLDKHAQWEIRKLAKLMYDIVSKKLPEVFPKLEEK